MTNIFFGDSSTSPPNEGLVNKKYYRHFLPMGLGLLLVWAATETVLGPGFLFARTGRHLLLGMIIWKKKNHLEEREKGKVLAAVANEYFLEQFR